MSGLVGDAWHLSPPVQEAVTANAVHGKTVPTAEPGKRGRRLKYCSTACKSKAARNKVKADAVRSVEGVRAEVLRCAEASVDAARVFLDAVAADPVAAYEEFRRQHGR
ncbi:hypothetical protein [Kitasatospora sp. KL5]|uniref:hypothetical protein n=1 Tax=Kitasatospora sp. KL5 TaxID=3425125 RepID=UPI003D6E409A